MTTEHLPKDISQLNSQLQAKFVHLNEVLDVVLKYSDLYKDRSPSKLLPFDNDKSSPEKSAKGDLSSFKGSPIKYNYESNNSNKHLSCEFSPGHSDMEAESPKLKVMRLLENIRPTDRSRISTPEKESHVYFGSVHLSLGDEVDDQSTEKKKPIKLAEPSTANTYNSGEPEMSSQKKINFQSLDNFENISGFNAEESAKKESSKLIQEVFKDYSEKGAEKNLRTLLEYVSLEHLITFCCLIKEMYKKVASQNQYFDDCATIIQKRYRKFASSQREKRARLVSSKQSSNLSDNASITEFSAEDAQRGLFDSQGSKAMSEQHEANKFASTIKEETQESQGSEGDSKNFETNQYPVNEIEARPNFSFRVEATESNHEPETEEKETTKLPTEPKGLCLEDLEPEKDNETRDPELLQETRAQTPVQTNPTTPLKYSKVIDDGSEYQTPNLHSDLSPPIVEHLSELYEDGTFYEGQKLNGLRHGKGNYDFNNGFKYFGDWSYDEMHGFGAMTVHDKLLYEGCFEHNVFQGHGTLHNLQASEKKEINFTSGDLSEWLRYEGKFVKGMRDGFGILFFVNGDHYMGNFKEGNFEGQGTYTKPGDYSLVGKWERNILKETIIKRSLVKTSDV